MKTRWWMSLAAGLVVVAQGAQAESEEELVSLLREREGRVVEKLERSTGFAKARCGEELRVDTDFPRTRASEGASSAVLDAHVQALIMCSEALETVAATCEGGRKTMPGKAAGGSAGVSVSAVSCLSTGAVQPKPGDDDEDIVRRNVSFAGGVLTVHVAFEAGNFKETLQSILRDLAKSYHLANGERCDSNVACASFFCRASVCTACSAKVPCASGFVCQEGVCIRQRSADEVERPRKRHRGSPCFSSEECESNSCRPGKHTGSVRFCD